MDALYESLNGKTKEEQDKLIQQFMQTMSLSEMLEAIPKEQENVQRERERTELMGKLFYEISHVTETMKRLENMLFIDPNVKRTRMQQLQARLDQAYTQFKNLQPPRPVTPAAESPPTLEAIETEWAVAQSLSETREQERRQWKAEDEALYSAIDGLGDYLEQLFADSDNEDGQ
jgi:hypothetical protein